MANVFIAVGNELTATPKIISKPPDNKIKLKFKAFYKGDKIGDFYVQYEIESRDTIQFGNGQNLYPDNPKKIELETTPTLISGEVSIIAKAIAQDEEVFKIRANIFEKDSTGAIIDKDSTSRHCMFIKN